MEAENGCDVYSVMLSISVSQDKHGSFPKDFHVTEVRFFTKLLLTILLSTFG